MESPRDCQGFSPKAAGLARSAESGHLDIILSPQPQRPGQRMDPLASIAQAHAHASVDRVVPSTPEPRPRVRHVDSSEKSPYRPQSTTSHSICELRPLSALSGTGSSSPANGSMGQRHMQFADTEEQQARKVFVGGVPQDWDNDKLREFFAKCDGLTKAWVQRHKEPHDAQQTGPSSQHRGFGWLLFRSLEHVDKLVGKGQTRRKFSMHDGRSMEVKRAEPYCNGTPSIPTPQNGLSVLASPCKHTIEAYPPQSPWGRSPCSGPTLEVETGLMLPSMSPAMPPPMIQLMPSGTFLQPMLQPMFPLQVVPPMPDMYSCPPQAVPGSQPWMSQDAAAQHRAAAAPIPADAAIEGSPQDASLLPDVGSTTPEDLAARVAQNPQMAEQLLSRAVPEVYED